ncbi:MAG: hypothetical protein WKF84_03115 [Pyrinomonadaceae bacterium]
MAKTDALVPPKDAESYGGSRVLLLGDANRRKTLGEKATESTVQRFDPSRAAMRLTEDLRIGFAASLSGV